MLALHKETQGQSKINPGREFLFVKACAVCDEGSGNTEHTWFPFRACVTVSHPVGGSRILQPDATGSLLIRTKGNGVIESLDMYTRILQAGGDYRV